MSSAFWVVAGVVCVWDDLGLRWRDGPNRVTILHFPCFYLFYDYKIVLGRLLALSCSIALRRIILFTPCRLWVAVLMARRENAFVECSHGTGRSYGTMRA